MAVDAWQNILVGCVGIATVISLVIFMIKSDSSKWMDEASYSETVKPYFLSFLAIDILFAIGILSIVEIEISFSFVIGPSILGLAAALQYLRPSGLRKKKMRHAPNWKVGVAVGVTMMVLGALMIYATYPMGLTPGDILRFVPLAMIGLGMLLTFVSAVSFRTTSVPDNNEW